MGPALRVAVLSCLAVILAIGVACGDRNGAPAPVTGQDDGIGSTSSQGTGSGLGATGAGGETATPDVLTPDMAPATEAAPTATAAVETPMPTPTDTPEPPMNTPTPVATPTAEVPTPVSTDTPSTETPATPETGDSQPRVTIGDASFLVEVADTPASQQQGLSGRESLAEGTGMLFVFDKERPLTFWMKEMNFPLDMVWIDASCTVVDISRDVPIPEPGQTLADLPTYGPETPAMYVLEINAGASADAGFGPGDSAAFTGGLEGKYGC